MVASVSQRVFIDSPLAIVAASFVSSLLSTFVFLALLFQFRPAALDLFSFSFVMFLEAVLTALVAPVVFPLPFLRLLSLQLNV